MSAKREAALGPFCACCGVEAPGVLFCDECLPHVAPDEGQPYWERCWFSVHGTVCPVEARDAIGDVA